MISSSTSALSGMGAAVGDMADFNIENGQLTDWEGRGEDERPVACKYCGEQGLFWTEVAPNRFRLVTEDGTVHNCEKFYTRDSG